MFLLLSLTFVTFLVSGQKPLAGKKIFVDGVDCTTYDLSLLYEMIEVVTGAKQAPSARLATEKISLSLEEVKGSRQPYAIVLVSKYGTTKVYLEYSLIGHIESVLSTNLEVCDQVAQALLKLVR